jgi:hypothetical protein
VQRERIEFAGALALGHGLLGAALHRQVHGIAGTRAGMVRVQFDGALEFALGCGPLPGVAFDLS